MIISSCHHKSLKHFCCVINEAVIKCTNQDLRYYIFNGLIYQFY